MDEIDTKIQPKNLRDAGSRKSKQSSRAIQGSANPGFRTNRSQENATPLFELSNKRNIPTTKLDEASKTIYTKNMEKLRHKH
ncbi:hypothetical protein [Lentibacillus juripiscarius]|uniref:Uncharacterized protein n=1 Tax=Lentibacillus juripiscarius TaxID=257446 RepID=A0ABW5V8T0_9BACI